MPEIRKAFQFETSQPERPILASYDAGDRGGFGAHRDNTVTARSYFEIQPSRLPPASGWSHRVLVLAHASDDAGCGGTAADIGRARAVEAKQAVETKGA